MAKMNCSKEEIDMDWRYTPVPTLSKDFIHFFKAIHNLLVVILYKLVIVAKLFETYLKLNSAFKEPSMRRATMNFENVTEKLLDDDSHPFCLED